MRANHLYPNPTLLAPLTPTLTRVPAEDGESKKKNKLWYSDNNAEALKSIALAPGMEVVVMVYYRPGPIDVNNENDFHKTKKHAFQLRRRDFLIRLSAMTFPASCRVCKNGVR